MKDFEALLDSMAQMECESWACWNRLSEDEQNEVYDGYYTIGKWARQYASAYPEATPNTTDEQLKNALSLVYSIVHKGVLRGVLGPAERVALGRVYDAYMDATKVVSINRPNPNFRPIPSSSEARRLAVSNPIKMAQYYHDLRTEFEKVSAQILDTHQVTFLRLALSERDDQIAALKKEIEELRK